MIYVDLLLKESRISDLIEKYPNVDITSIKQKLSPKEEKYIPWIVKYVDFGYEEDYLIELVMFFVDHKMKKDIYSMKPSNIEDMKKFIVYKNTLTAPDDAIVLFEDQNYILYHITTQRASCDIGKGTKWCVAATKTQNYFEYYNKLNVELYFIIRKKKQNDGYDKVAFAKTGNTFEYFNSSDVSLLAKWVEFVYGKEYFDFFKKIINNYSLKLNPLSKFFMNPTKFGLKIIKTINQDLSDQQSFKYFNLFESLLSEDEKNDYQYYNLLSNLIKLSSANFLFNSDILIEYQVLLHYDKGTILYKIKNEISDEEREKIFRRNPMLKYELLFSYYQDFYNKLYESNEYYFEMGSFLKFLKKFIKNFSSKQELEQFLKYTFNFSLSSRENFIFSSYFKNFLYLIEDDEESKEMICSMWFHDRDYLEEIFFPFYYFKNGAELFVKLFLLNAYTYEPKEIFYDMTKISHPNKNLIIKKIYKLFTIIKKERPREFYRFEDLYYRLGDYIATNKL